MDVYLGIDVGSVTAKYAVITGVGEFIAANHLCTWGKPPAVVQRGLGEVEGQLPADVRIRGRCTTGSVPYLEDSIVDADVVENEIAAQAVAALYYVPDVCTVIEVGGQIQNLSSSVMV
jgi:activator of 2-hydroxyglutaryl-CoA dehydratase